MQRSHDVTYRHVSNWLLDLRKQTNQQSVLLIYHRKKSKSGGSHIYTVSHWCIYCRQLNDKTICLHYYFVHFMIDMVKANINNSGSATATREWTTTKRTRPEFLNHQWTTEESWTGRTESQNTRSKLYKYVILWRYHGHRWYVSASVALVMLYHTDWSRCCRPTWRQLLNLYFCGKSSK